MRCKKCGWVSKYPVCKDCATDEERELQLLLEKISVEIRKNNLEILRCHLKLPVLSPMFYIAMISFFFYGGFSLFYLGKINNSVLKYIVMFILPLFFTILSIIILFALVNTPEENVTNGLKTIDLKHQNLILRRRKKKYLKLLSAPFDNWSKDERIETKFVSYES